jgi:hypothetical protein
VFVIENGVLLLHREWSAGNAQENGVPVMGAGNTREWSGEAKYAG